MTKPPLLMIAEGRKPRPRKAQKFAPREIVLHMSVAKVLRQTARPDWRWTHFPSGEERSVIVGAKLKRMGLQPGWPDFLLVSPASVAHFLELKRRGEDLNDAQKEMQIWAAAHGVPFSVADNFDCALAVLKHWGALRIAEAAHG